LKTPASDYEEWADDIKLVFDALNIKKAHLLGWSMGAAVIFDFAVKYPERTDKLVQMAPLGP